MEDYFQAKAQLFTRAAQPARRGQPRRRVRPPAGRGGRRSRSSPSPPRATRTPTGAPRTSRSARSARRSPLVGPKGERVRAAVAAAGPVQRRQHPRRDRRPRRRRASTRRPPPTASPPCPGVPGRLERVDAGPAVPRGRRLRAQDRRRRVGPARPAQGHRGQAARRARLRRRPGPAPSAARWAPPLARLADTAVLTSDNPRSEDPLAILAAMLAGAAEVPAHERGDVLVDEDRAAAIAAAVARAEPGDTVLVAGKGHEQGQDIAGVVRPFDDRQVLREAIGTQEPREPPASHGPTTGQTLSDRPLPRRDRRSRRRAARTTYRIRPPRSPGPSSSTPARWSPAASSPPSPASASTATTSRRGAVEAGAVAVLATRPVGVPADRRRRRPDARSARSPGTSSSGSARPSWRSPAPPARPAPRT